MIRIIDDKLNFVKETQNLEINSYKDYIKVYP